MRSALLFALLPLAAAELRIGIVGTDTSHVPAFTALFNDAGNRNYMPGARVVAAYKGGSPDLPDSANRVEKFAEEIRTKYGVEIVSDIPALLAKVDAVLLESVDGRVHLSQAREIFKGGKPVFIDKPLASTLADARAIAELGRAAGVKWFSSSSLRYSSVLAPLKVSGLEGAMVWGPAPISPTHALELSWYGIHAVEMLYTLMGPGCVDVTRTYSDNSEVVTGRWKDGRIGVARLARPSSGYGAVVFTGKEILKTSADASTGYVGLVKEILKFFQTGVAPVSESETLEIFAFLDAAQRSKLNGGRPEKLN